MKIFQNENATLDEKKAILRKTESTKLWIAYKACQNNWNPFDEQFCGDAELVECELLGRLANYDKIVGMVTH